MELNKEICKRCIDTMTDMSGHVYWYGDEMRWEKGEILCPNSEGWVKPINKIPDRCHFKLEHIVMEIKMRNIKVCRKCNHFWITEANEETVPVLYGCGFERKYGSVFGFEQPYEERDIPKDCNFKIEHLVLSQLNETISEQ